MIKEELLGVQEGPDNVLIGRLFFALPQVGKRQVHFFTLRLPGIEPEVEFAQFFLLRTFIITAQEPGSALLISNLS